VRSRAAPRSGRIGGLGQVGEASARRTPQVHRRDGEDGVGQAGRGPHHRVIEQTPIHEHVERTGMAQWRHTTDREAGGPSRLVAAGPSHRGSADDRAQALDVEPDRAGEQGDQWHAIGHEDQRLDDLGDIAADGQRRIGGCSRPGREALDADGQARGGRRRDHAFDVGMLHQPIMTGLC